MSTIGAVWWRKPLPYKFPPELSEQACSFARLEWDTTLRGTWDALDCYWMSFPDSIRLASYKPGQLKRAADLGFDVPRTVITTDPAEVRALYERCNGAIVYKVLSDPSLGMSTRLDQILSQCVIGVGPDQQPIVDWSRAQVKMTYTTPVTATQLAMLDAIRLAPCQFQEYIPKRLELRVTVVGDELFTAEIHSQAHERTRIDWRHYDVPIPYRKGSLPVEVAERCLALTRGYDLNFSAIDLILTPDGRYVFLEINPNGQWLWVQQSIPDLKIKEAIAAQLSRGAMSAA
jgi:glutathione synthase/RimK-type ligase-like ATP-grasp enzyme